MRFNGQKSPERRSRVERGLVVSLNADGRIYPQEFDSFRKTALTYAAQIPEAFEVDTLEGVHTGKAGDWLAIGPHGEMYPIDAAVFEDSYEPT